jgi:hypothetical protein
MTQHQKIEKNIDFIYMWKWTHDAFFGIINRNWNWALKQGLPEIIIPWYH